MNMSLSEKPFACNEKNCYRTFTNEDHLNSHRKRHYMSFNLDLTTKNNEAVLGDQTPTPTSFFRNCEEVGLFQDLQNVNPFEETFKKALENSTSCESRTSKTHSVTNEDTLHTPHIFPSVEELSTNNTSDINNSDLSMVNLIEIPQICHKIEIGNEVSSHKVEAKQTYLRNKLKEALMKKDKIKFVKHLENTPNRGLRNTVFNHNKLDKSKSIKILDKSNIERIREINRVAQMKCRVKKKREMDKLTSELFNLKKENEELRKENARLSKTNTHLWKFVEDLGGLKDSGVIHRIRTSLDEIELDNPAVPPLKTNPKQLPVLVPADTILVPKNTSPSAPIILNLVPVQILNGTPPPASSISRQKLTPRILRKT